MFCRQCGSHLNTSPDSILPLWVVLSINRENCRRRLWLCGEQVGYIALYRGREEIKRVTESEGVSELINLIKADGRWVEP